MKELIACCGLDCEACEARRATLANDDALRAEVAKKWSELNRVDIPPESINCMGCRTEGAKFAYCDTMCPIRKCAREKGYGTCAECGGRDVCEKVALVIGTNAEARRNLEEGQ